MMVAMPQHQFTAVLDAQHPVPDVPFHPTALWPYTPAHLDTPLRFVDVYIDDFMAIVQRPLHMVTMHNLLHHLNMIFYDVPGSPRKSVVSTTKINKGDATFNTTQRILRWDIDTVHMTVRLPAHHQQRLHTLLQQF
jgi:thiamine kinase-like enzyme